VSVYNQGYLATIKRGLRILRLLQTKYSLLDKTRENILKDKSSNRTEAMLATIAVTAQPGYTAYWELCPKFYRRAAVIKERKTVSGSDL